VEFIKIRDYMREIELDLEDDLLEVTRQVRWTFLGSSLNIDYFSSLLQTLYFQAFEKLFNFWIRQNLVLFVVQTISFKISGILRNSINVSNFTTSK
jgi:hypothetical protein